MSKKRKEATVPVKLVKVTWVDAAFEGAKWLSVRSLRQSAGLVRCRHVGWVVRETKRVLVLASGLNQSGEASGVVAIPKSCILKLKRLGGTER